LADAITAMQNNSRPTSTFEELQQTMRGVEERIDARLAAISASINSHTSLRNETLGIGINAHTSRTAELTSDAHTAQKAHLLA
jgi:hypothetical protein